MERGSRAGRQRWKVSKLKLHRWEEVKSRTTTRKREGVSGHHAVYLSGWGAVWRVDRMSVCEGFGKVSGRVLAWHYLAGCWVGAGAWELQLGRAWA
jgi:hypothetical protein